MSQQDFEERLIAEKLGGNSSRLGRRELKRDTVVPIDQGPVPEVARTSFAGIVYFDIDNPERGKIGEWNCRKNNGYVF